MTVAKRLARNTDFVHKHVCCRTEGEPMMIQREKKSREAESQACGILVWPHTCQEVSSLVETVPDSKCELILEMSRAPFTDDLCMCRRPSRRHLGRAHCRRGGCQEAHVKWKNTFLGSKEAVVLLLESALNNKASDLARGPRSLRRNVWSPSLLGLFPGSPAPRIGHLGMPPLHSQFTPPRDSGTLCVGLHRELGRRPPRGSWAARERRLRVLLLTRGAARAGSPPATADSCPAKCFFFFLFL